MAAGSKRLVESLGASISEVLKGVWRLHPPPVSDEWSGQILRFPELLESDTAALCWWRCRNAEPARRRSARVGKDAFRLNRVHFHSWREQFQRTIAALQDAGIPSIHFKGLATNTYYAQFGLRPNGDIDLCVAPENLNDARTIIRSLSPRVSLVDLHAGIPDLKDRAWPELFDRSQIERLGETEFRVLCPEDHLRLLCLHYVRHLGVRPLWLVDVAAALEAADDKFDWDLCLRGRKCYAEWVLSIVGLAQRLLDAQVNDQAIARRANRLPNWLTPYTFWCWEQKGNLPRMKEILNRPRESWGQLREFPWLNPMRASYRMQLRPTANFATIQTYAAAAHLIQLANRLYHSIRRPAAKERFFDVHRERLF